MIPIILTSLAAVFFEVFSVAEFSSATLTTKLFIVNRCGKSGSAIQASVIAGAMRLRQNFFTRLVSSFVSAFVAAINLPNVFYFKGLAADGADPIERTHIKRP